MTAAEDETYVPEKAVSSLQGWIDCFEKQPAHSRVFKHEPAKIIFTGRFMGLRSGSCNIYHRNRSANPMVIIRGCEKMRLKTSGFTASLVFSGHFFK